MTELEKLAAYLREHRYAHICNCIPYFDADGTLITGEANQIIVFKEDGSNRHDTDPDTSIGGASRAWDAVCYRGTYGGSEGLIEIMGEICSPGGDVEGWLTAEEIIRRLEGRK